MMWKTLLISRESWWWRVMMLAYGKEDLTIRLCSLPMRLGSSSGWYNRSVVGSKLFGFLKLLLNTPLSHGCWCIIGSVQWIVWCDGTWLYQLSLRSATIWMKLETICSSPVSSHPGFGVTSPKVYHIQITQRLGMRSLDHSLVHRWISGRGCVSDMLCRLLSIWYGVKGTSAYMGRLLVQLKFSIKFWIRMWGTDLLC